MLEEEWSQRAELDIQSIVIFLAVECKNLQAARKAEEKILAAIDMLKEFPDMGGTLKDDSLKRSYRTMLVHPYVIYYTYDEKTLIIRRVLHQRQALDTYALVEF